MIYKLQKDPMTNKIDAVNKVEENKLISIPFDESNRHYQEYLEWTKASPMNVASQPDED